MQSEKGQFHSVEVKEAVEDDYKKKYESNMEKTAVRMECLRVYACGIGSEKILESEVKEFTHDMEIMTDQLRLAVQGINRRIFDRSQGVNRGAEITDEQIEKAQNDIGQISLIARDLANLSVENVEVVEAKKGEGDKNRVKLDMENSQMEIVINPQGTKQGQARIAFNVFYKDEYLEKLEKEISRSLSLRIDVTPRGIYIDVDSSAIKEVLMVEKGGRRFPDYHIKTLEDLDIKVFKRLTEQVTELLPVEIREKIEDKVNEEMSRQLILLSRLYNKNK